MSSLSRSLALLAFAGWTTLAFATRAPQSSPVRATGVQDSVAVADLPARVNDVPWLRLELPDVRASHPFLGDFPFEAHETWKPVCSSAAQNMTQQEFTKIVATHKHMVQSPNPQLVIDNNSTYVPGGLNLVFTVSGSIPAGATAAIAAAEAYLEGIFTTDPITVTIPVSFQVMASNILGGTGSSYGSVTYSGTRSLIVGNKDASDTIQSFLPTTSTCPVRYNGNSSTVTNETRVFFTFANYKAVGGSVAGNDANMTFNSIFNFDYDPSNGITANAYSFQDVVIHETGHALGCTSGGDFRVNDMEVMDLFRFQRTDGTGDYNPDTTAEFQARARLVDYNTPNDNHNFDFIAAEYRLSDGSPYQMSHFREQAANIGLMDPALAPNETWYPAFFSSADVNLFDAIGYDK